MSSTPCRLWCLANGDDIPFCVDASSTINIHNLKGVIKEKMRIDVAAHKLILWKPRDAIPVMPSNALAQRLRDLGPPGLPQLAEKLEPAKSVSVAFSFQIQTSSPSHLDVIVQLPSSLQDDGTGGALESSSKRRRLADDPNPLGGVGFVDALVWEELRQFWKSLWEDKRDPFRMEPVRRGPNPLEGIDVPATMELMRLPVIFSSIGDVMVRDDYDRAMRDIESYYTRNTKSVIVVGHPGIGKTILLYYILVKRLFEQKPTIFQNDHGHLYVFNANGVKVMSASMVVHPKSAEFQNTWALVDINPHVQEPASMIGHVNNPFFLIMASSPRPSRLRRLQKFGRPGVYWLMKPFSLAELIQARQLQRVIHEESDIENFFKKYGPSASDCYDSCGAGALAQYVDTVRGKVQVMSWDLITEILTRHPADIRAEEGSHIVLLVVPQPENRTASRTRIVTKTVSQLLWERDSDEQWRNHHKLFKTLLRISGAKAFLGTVFEPAFHDLCIRGVTFTIYPMVRRRGTVNYIFTNDRPRRSESDSGSEILMLNAQTQIDFDDQNNRMTSLLANHYYQPAASSYPSYDSFVFDPDFHQISAFQVPTAEVHGLRSKGVSALYEIGRRLKIDDLKIRIIAVVFGDAQVTFKVPKDLIQSLGCEMYALEVTEKQLYPYS